MNKNGYESTNTQKTEYMLHTIVAKISNQIQKIKKKKKRLWVRNVQPLGTKRPALGYESSRLWIPLTGSAVITHAGRTLILLILSCRGSFQLIHIEICILYLFVHWLIYAYEKVKILRIFFSIRIALRTLH